MVFWRFFSIFYIFVLLIFLGCLPSTDQVSVKLTFIANSGNPIIKDVTVISGGDKFHWYTFPLDSQQTVTLTPGQQALPKLTLIYTINGQQLYWEGPDIPMGKGFQIEISVPLSGSIDYRYCIAPCTLN
jgi:hypothetical protein